MSPSLSSSLVFSFYGFFSLSVCQFNGVPSPSSPLLCRPGAPLFFSTNLVFVHLSLQLSSFSSHLSFILSLPLNITLIVSFFFPLNIAGDSLIHVPVDISPPDDTFNLRLSSALSFPTSTLLSPSLLFFFHHNPHRLSYLPNALCVLPHRSLDLTGPLFLGGVPNVPDNFPFGAREFIGCIKEFHIDNKPLDLAGFIANNGTLAG